MQSSPNGGELLNTNVNQDTNRSPEINQRIQQPILPSSKYIAPVFDLEKYEQKKKQEIMPSSKSGLHPIRINPDVEEVTLENPYAHSSKSLIITDFKPLFKNLLSENNREAIKKQPELIPDDKKDSLVRETKTTSKEKNHYMNEIKGAKVVAREGTSSKSISWISIGLGVLGILFVGIGSIVYFKRRSK